MVSAARDGSRPAVTPPVRFGVLGCADIARRNGIPALVADPAVRLVAVSSRSADKARAFADRFGCAAVTGYERLLERDDIDAVYVPLPPALHHEWIGRALATGRHVLAEKPLAVSLREVTGLTRAAADAGLVLMENFAFLHHAQHARVRRMLADGAIGELRHLTAEFGFPPVHAADIRYRPELGGGALLDAGVYPIRAAAHYLGPDVRVLGAHRRMDPGSGVDVGGAALVASADGVSGHLTFGFDRSYRNSYTLWGSSGLLTVQRAFSAPPSLRPVVRVERQDHVEEFTMPADNHFARIVAAFVAAVTGQTPHDQGRAAIEQQAALLDAVLRHTDRTEG
ncbi:Gfo/Idh/MocA family oxidoreductase [Dactylosporangium fulvum]